MKKTIKILGLISGIIFLLVVPVFVLYGEGWQKIGAIPMVLLSIIFFINWKYN